MTNRLEHLRDSVTNQEHVALFNLGLNEVGLLLNAEPTGVLSTAYGPFTLEALDPGGVDEADPGELEAFRKTLR